MVWKRYGNRRGGRKVGMVKEKAVGRRVKEGGRKMVMERREAQGSRMVGKESVELGDNGQVQAEAMIGVAEVDHPEVVEAEATTSRRRKMRRTTRVRQSQRSS